MNDDGVMSRSEAARRVGVTAQTLARWAQDGLVPHAGDGRWTPAAVAHHGPDAAEDRALVLELGEEVLARVQEKVYDSLVNREGAL